MQAKWRAEDAPLEQNPDALNVRLLTYLKSRQFTKVMFYWPMWDEVDIAEVVMNHLEQHDQVILMRFGRNSTMLPRFVFSTHDLKKNRFGIWVPKRECIEADLEEIEAVILPARAYDRHCNRIGRGYGYYDRFLSQPEFTGEAIGVAYEFQLCDQVPVEDHDSPVDLIITEQQTILR